MTVHARHAKNILDEIETIETHRHISEPAVRPDVFVAHHELKKAAENYRKVLEWQIDNKVF